MTELRALYPPTEPAATGWLDVDDGHAIYWTRRRRAGGIPAIILHGGPGGGMSADEPRMFDPDRYDTFACRTPSTRPALSHARAMRQTRRLPMENGAASRAGKDPGSVPYVERWSSVPYCVTVRQSKPVPLTLAHTAWVSWAVA